MESALQTFSLKMSMQHNADSLWRPAFLLWQTSPLILITGASRYRRCWSLAERPPLCRDKCRILALGTAVSAAGESGHIGSWLPQFSFSLVESKKSFHSVKIYSRLFVLCPMGIKWQHKNKKQLSRSKLKLIGRWLAPSSDPTENTLDWNFARRMQQCAPGWKRPRKRSQSAKASPQLLFFPFSELQFFWRVPDVCVWLSGVDTRRRKRWPQTLLESGNHARSMKQRPKLQRDVTAGIWLVLHAGREQLWEQFVFYSKGFKEVLESVGCSLTTESWPKPFLRFCAVPDPGFCQNKQINKYTKPP